MDIDSNESDSFEDSEPYNFENANNLEQWIDKKN